MIPAFVVVGGIVVLVVGNGVVVGVVGFGVVVVIRSAFSEGKTQQFVELSSTTTLMVFHVRFSNVL